MRGLVFSVLGGLGLAALAYQAWTNPAAVRSQVLAKLAARFPGLQQTLAPALASADQNLAAAAKSALDLDRSSAANSLAAAGKEIAALREQLARQPGDQERSALWELDRVKDQIDFALADDIAIPFEARASRHELVAGENFSVDVVVSGEPAVLAKWTLNASSFVVPSGWNVTSADSRESGATRFDIAILSLLTGSGLKTCAEIVARTGVCLLSPPL